MQREKLECLVTIIQITYRRGGKVMKKFLSRILVILIAMITLFEVALPPTIRGNATYNIAYAKEEDKKTLEKIGNVLLFGLNWAISNMPGGTTLEQIVRDITADTPIGDFVEETTRL